MKTKKSKIVDRIVRNKKRFYRGNCLFNKEYKDYKLKLAMAKFRKVELGALKILQL